jgi:hypothetical protein
LDDKKIIQKGSIRVPKRLPEFIYKPKTAYLGKKDQILGNNLKSEEIKPSWLFISPNHRA